MEIGKKVQDYKRRKQLLEKNIEFNVGRIQKNQIGIGQQLYSDGDYIFEESLQDKSLVCVDKNIQVKQSSPKKSNKGILEKHTQQNAKSLMNQLAYPIHIKNKMKSVQKQNKQNKPIENDKENDIQIEQIHEDDLTQLWQKIQMEHKQNNNVRGQSPEKEINSKIKQQKQQMEQNQENSKIVQNNSQNLIHENSESSCQLTQQQLKMWMDSCEQTQNPKKRHSNRSNCIYQTDQGQGSKLTNKQDEQNQQDFAQWDQIAQFLQKQDQQVKEVYKNEGLVSLANMTEQKHEEEFFIIDTQSKFKSQQQKKVKQIQKTNSYHKNTSKFGPWVYSHDHYEIYKKYKIKLIQQLNLKVESGKQLTGQQQNLIYNESRSIRKINWQISQERNPEVKNLRSKRYCKMNLVQYGRDFLIFDHFKFVTEPVREGSHIYLGIRSFGDFSQVQSRQISQKSLNPSEKNIRQIKQYMYLPGNGECLLQTAYQNLESQTQIQNNIKSFDILLSLTMQKVAVCQRIMIEEEKDKRERIMVKMYDNFQKSAQNYLGIVQSKISNFSDQWYCDTIIYIPKRKVCSSKNFDKEWEKFRIQLRLSEVGTIVAELGIFDASSSVTNCILFGQSKYTQFMMGTISQNSKQINYITRIAGLSPIMAFATILSRKIFVMSS